MKKLNLFRSIVAVSFSIFAIFPTSANLQVPKGFEEFARGEDDMLLVSIYGTELGLFKVHVDLDNVTFLEPNKLAESVKSKFNSSEKLQQIITDKLKESLKRNTNLACSNSSDANCDFIKTDSVAAIYDENNAAILLFFPAEFAPEVKAKNPYYMATKDTNSALIHQQAINFTADKDSKNVTLQGNTTLGITSSSYANMNWNWNGQDSTNGFNKSGYLNNLFVRKDFLKKYYLQAGIMDSSDIYTNAGGAINFNQLPLNRIEGVRIGSTLAWTNIASQLVGTPINVILTRESRVDIYRGKELLTSVYMSAGAQQIDGNSLPAGSYLITLKIYEDNRLVRTEQTPYTRLSSGMSDSLQWFMQAGRQFAQDRQSDVEKNSSKQIAAAGVRIPLPFSSALTVGASCNAGVFYNETALEWTHGFNSGPIDGILYLRNSLFHGSNGSSGSNQQINYNDGFSLSFNRTTSTESTIESLQGKPARRNASGTDMAFSIPVGSWNMSLTYRRTKNSSNIYYNTFDPSATLNNNAFIPVAYETSSRSWQLALTRSFNAYGIIFNTSLSGFKTQRDNRNRPDIGGYFNLNMSSYAAGDNNTLLSFGARYATSRENKDSINYNAGYSHSDGTNTTAYSVSGLNTDSAYLSASRSLNSSLGEGNIFLTDSYDIKNNQHQLSSSGTYNFGLAADRHGIYLGKWNSGQAASAVVVDMSDNAKTAQVEASVGYASNLQIQGNSKRLITINPYQTSKLEFNETTQIKNGISSSIKQGGAPKDVFMAPGQLLRNTIKMESRYTWIGTMFNEDKKPLSQAQPLNVASWTALGGGAFLVETSNELKKLYLTDYTSFWECSLVVHKVKEVVRWVGNTSCKTITYAALPAAEAKQAKLQMASQTGSTTNDNIG